MGVKKITDFFANSRVPHIKLLKTINFLHFFNIFKKNHTRGEGGLAFNENYRIFMCLLVLGSVGGVGELLVAVELDRELAAVINFINV